MPMQTMQNRFYSFIEDTARIWADFWVMKYGSRHLKIEDADGTTWYMPFDGNRYRELLINARIDVGAATLWSESQSIRTLDNLFDRQVIDVVQYLTRLPKGTVPNVNGLIREMQRANQAVAQTASVDEGAGIPTTPTAEDIIGGLTPENREMFDQIPEQARTALLKNAIASGGVV